MKHDAQFMRITARRPAREPSARRDDHQGGAELSALGGRVASVCPEAAPEDRPVLVVDLGGQYSQLIARRIRECRVYSELVGTRSRRKKSRARNPYALVLSGGPASVYADGAPHVDPALFELGIPTLGICYGMQLMALQLGGRVDRTGVSEFGKTDLGRTSRRCCRHGFGADRVDVHRDSVVAPPEGAVVVAGSQSTPIAAFEEPERKLYGVDSDEGRRIDCDRS